jgi:hypothetical protein
VSNASKITKLTVILLATLGVGCANKKDPQESKLTHAYRLIDAGKDDEAIAYLEAACPEGSEDNNCRAAMASAYAHKAEIKIQKFVPALTTTKTMGNLQLVFNSTQNQGEISSQIDASMAHFSTLMSQFTGVLGVYASIPAVKDDLSPYLDQAIHILETLKNPSPTVALYRAVLRVIYFKHTFAEEIVGAGTKEKLGPECKLDLGLVNNSINDLGHTLIAILDDLALANPSRAKSLQNMQSQVASEMLALTSDLSSATVLDVAGSLYVKHLVLEQGFGKLLKCEESSAH